MNDQQVGLGLRAIRHRRGWTQGELSRRSGVSTSVISEIELGRLEQQKVGVVRRVSGALDARFEGQLRWRGGELDRLLDADHAHLGELRKRQLESAGWDVEVEVSFNHFGDRGRYDLLSFHRPTRTLLVDENKTMLADAQGMLGAIDVKERLARRVASRFGWRAERVVVGLVMTDERTNRRRIAQHSALFSRFELRGRSSSAWLRDPRPPARGMLVFLKLPNSATSGARRAGRQRMRPKTPDLSVKSEPTIGEKADSAA